MNPKDESNEQDTIIKTSGPDVTKVAPRLTVRPDQTTVAPRSMAAGRSFTVVVPESLLQRFTVLEQLPIRGSEADIFKVCFVDEPSETYILKLYREGIFPDAAIIEEVQKLASVHAIGIFEHGKASPTQYFELQEYATHGSLHDQFWMTTNEAGQRSLALPRSTSEHEIYRVLEELSKAVEHIQDRKIVHRDLKPDNILVRSIQPLDLVLADFGLARAGDGDISRMTNIEQGTPYYMAPESLSYEYHPFKTDIWAVGVIIYELLRQRHPFLGLEIGVIKNQLVKTRTPIVVEGVSEHWRVLLEGLLQSNVLYRWNSGEVSAWLKAHQVDGLGQLMAVGAYIPPARDEMQFDVPFNFLRDNGTVIEVTSRHEMAVVIAENPKRALSEFRRGSLERFFAERGAIQTQPAWKEIAVELKKLENEVFDDHITQWEIDVEANLKIVALLNPQLPPYLMGKLVSLEKLDEIIQSANLVFFNALKSKSEWQNNPDIQIVYLILEKNFFQMYCKATKSNLDSFYWQFSSEIIKQWNRFSSLVTWRMFFDEWQIIPNNLCLPISEFDDLISKFDYPCDPNAKKYTDLWSQIIKILNHCVQKMKISEKAEKIKYEAICCEDILIKDDIFLTSLKITHHEWYLKILEAGLSSFSERVALDYYFEMGKIID